MSASSSAVKLGDLALTWIVGKGHADLSLIDSDLASELGLETAVMLSLFLDRRAADDDVPPSGDPQDRRGWWGDEFLPNRGDRIGSRLWLLDRSKLTQETALSAREYAIEALAWMLEDQVVDGVDVVTELAPPALLMQITLRRPGRNAVTFRYSLAWDNSEGGS